MMDVAKALREGPYHLRNAEDSKNRKIPNADSLYFWENQVAAIDTYLTDTELMEAENGELKDTRAKLAALKKEIERKIIEFEATAAGEPVPDDPPAEEMLAILKEAGGDVLEVAREASKRTPKDVKGLREWEEPMEMLNAFLADSEPFNALDPEFAKLRDAIRLERMKMVELSDRIFRAWREADVAGGADD
jgi:hypothetical protein